MRDSEWLVLYGAVQSVSASFSQGSSSVSCRLSRQRWSTGEQGRPKEHSMPLSGRGRQTGRTRRARSGAMRGGAHAPESHCAIHDRTTSMQPMPPGVGPSNTEVTGQNRESTFGGIGQACLSLRVDDWCAAVFPRRDTFCPTKTYRWRILVADGLWIGATCIT